MSNKISTVKDVFRACGGRKALSEGIGVPAGTVNAWWDRNSIPARYDVHFVRLSGGKVTLEDLARLRAFT